MIRKVKYEKSLAYLNPNLAKEWHPTKNGDVKSTEVSISSGGKVWWYLPYDDPNTGKHFEFEWEGQISTRNKGAGCPFLSGHDVWLGFNDLSTTHPEMAEEWHPKKNGELTPEMVTRGYTKKVWWFLPYDDQNTGIHFDFEWQATVANRINGQGCPVLVGKMVWRGFNDLETVAPSFAEEWHPTKNGKLLPSEITPNCNKKVWWFLPYDGSETGKHFEFEWETSPNSRISQNAKCPYLCGQKVWIGYNDLATTNPELALEWNYNKNGRLTPNDVVEFSNIKVWWLLPFDDPNTGKHFDFEWKAKVSDRSKGSGCPFLPSASNRQVWKGYNDLATVNPYLAKEWHPQKNKNLTPDMVTVRSHRKVWWLLSYDDLRTGKHFDFEWKAVISSRTNGRKCPYISNEAAWKGFNDLETLNPILAKEWHPTNNIKKPSDYNPISGKKVWWLCNKGHEWKSAISHRSNGRGCPYCAGKLPIVGETDFYTLCKDIASEWNYERNKKTPQQFTKSSGAKVWWKCSYGHEWRAKIHNRANGDGCPRCAKQIRRYNSQ